MAGFLEAGKEGTLRLERRMRLSVQVKRVSSFLCSAPGLSVRRGSWEVQSGSGSNSGSEAANWWPVDSIQPTDWFSLAIKTQKKKTELVANI